MMIDRQYDNSEMCLKHQQWEIEYLWFYLTNLNLLQ